MSKGERSEQQTGIHRAKTNRENFDAFRSGFDSLEKLARKSGLKACYQNHSTYNKKVPLFGSLVWDLASVVKDHDPKYIGIQYDPMHVRAEGVAPRYTVHYDYDFPADETGARAFASSDLRHYRSILG